MKRLEFMTESELADLMRSVAKDIEACCKRKGVERPHFALVLFNDPKIAQYIGNCDRRDIVAAMRETADRLAKRQDVPR